MRGERLWGQRVWVWYLHAALAAAYLLLLVLSRTESGRIFAVMLLIAQTFAAGYMYVGWIRSQLRPFDEGRTSDG